MTHQFFAEIHLFATDAGGRKSPLPSGEWRTVLGINNEYWSARLTFSDQTSPGQDAMLYVNKDRHKVLEGQHGNLHVHAMKTLREHSANNLATHSKEKDGDTVLLAMMHEDGLGSSRLLLLAELKERFRSGAAAA